MSYLSIMPPPWAPRSLTEPVLQLQVFHYPQCGAALVCLPLQLRVPERLQGSGEGGETHAAGARLG